MSECGKIFVSFFKIGLFTFGGGYAMMPLFRRELIERRGYISENELIDYYSVGQCLPGVIAINVATFTGYKVQGVSGAIAATLAVNLPSLVIIMALAGILNTLSENQIVSHAFAGINLQQQQAFGIYFSGGAAYICSSGNIFLVGKSGFLPESVFEQYGETACRQFFYDGRNEGNSGFVSILFFY